MWARVFSTLLGWLSSDVLKQVLGHLEAKANSETERLRIQATREAQANAEAASVIKHAMGFKVFWIPWLIAAVPTSLWFGWGMMDSLFNGALPDVAALPPQLLVYADVVFKNIFYTGAGVASVQMIGSSIRGRK